MYSSFPAWSPSVRKWCVEVIWSKFNNNTRNRINLSRLGNPQGHIVKLVWWCCLDFILWALRLFVHCSYVLFIIHFIVPFTALINFLARAYKDSCDRPCTFVEGWCRSHSPLLWQGLLWARLSLISRKSLLKLFQGFDYKSYIF